MANNAEFTMTFKVREDGSLVAVERNINRAGKATKDLGTAQREAGRASDEHNYKLNQGAAATASAGRNMSKLAQTIGSGPNGLVGAYATLAANAFAVSAAFNALRSAAQVQQLIQGLEVQGSRTGRTLSLVSDSILQITKNSISAADAMRAASQGQAAGLNKKDLEELTQVATNASIALGRNIPDSMERIIKGVTKLEPELLDELGLMTKLTEATENYARAQGKSVSSLTGLEKRKAFVEAIKKEGELKFGGISEQVDVNRFDQLAASFQNLTNKLLGIFAASAPVNGILSLLIDTTYGLGGALAIFGSMIGKQVTDWLRQIAISAASAAAALNKQAIAQRNAADASLQASKVKVGSAQENVKGAVALSKNVPQGYKEMLASRAAGTLTQEQEEKGLKSLERSTSSYEGKITRLTKSKTADTQATKDKIAAYKEEIATNELRLASEKELQIAQAYASKRQDANTARAERANAAQYATTKLSKAATSLEAASGITTIPKAISSGVESVAAYAKELESTRKGTVATATAMGKSIPIFGMIAPVADGAKVALYGLKLGIQGVGTALMAVLPWIGIISILFSVFELLYDKFFVTEADRAKKKALEELNTVLEGTANHIKELNRVTALDLQEGTKYSKMTEIKMNSLIELADAYIKVSEAAQLANYNEAKAAAAKAAIEEKKNKTINYTGDGVAQANLEKTLVDRQKYIADAANVAFDSKALDVFSNTLIKTWGGFGDWNEEGIKAIQTADQLNQLSPELAKGFFETAKNVKTQEEKIALLNKTLREARKEYSPIRDQLLEFTESLKAAENAQTDFLKSLKPTTPFDTVLTNMQALTTSMSELDRLMSSKEGAASKDFSGSFQKIITQVGPNIAKALDAGGQTTLSSYNNLTTQINSLNAAIEEGKIKKQDTKGLEQDLIAATAQRAKYESYLGKIIPEQVAGYTELLASAQEQTILAQSQVTLAQARLSVIQRQGTVTGADVKRQMEAQNAILSAQQAQEKVKLQFIKLDLDKLNITIQEITAQQELLQILKKQNIEKDDAAQKALLANVRLERANLIAQGKTGSPEAIALAAKEAELIKPKDQRKDADKLAEEARQADQARRTLQAGADAASNAVNALSMQMFTATEISVQAALQDLKVSKDNYEVKKNILNVTMTRVQQEQKLASLMNMRTQDISKNEIAAINETANARANERAKEFKFKKEELDLNIKLARSRGLSNQVNAYNAQLDLETRKNAADQASIESQRAIEILNKVAIKDEEDLISRKQNVLTYQEKILEAKRAEVEASRALSESQIDLSAKLRGVTDTGATDRLKAIKAAQDAYNLAKEEAATKKEQIDLEFQLLRAKRALLMMELLTAQQTLSSERQKATERLNTVTALKSAEEKRLADQRAKDAKKDKGNKDEIVVTGNLSSPLLAQLETETTALTSTLNGFATQNIVFAELNAYWNKIVPETLADGATKMKKAIDDGVTTLANKAAEVAATGPLVKGGLVSQMENIKERQKGRKAAGVSETSIEGISTTVLQEMDSYIDSVRENLKSLGPEGEVVLAVATAAQSIGSSFVDAFKKMGEAGATSSEKTVAALQAVSAVIAGVASILKATSDAKIAGIDKEIAAEQKRDGKSAASLDKIKAMEKKKDDIARKSFNIQKKLMMAQAVVSTAAAIAMAIGQLGPIAGPIMAGVMAAMGAAQIAIIAGTSYESASPSAVSAMPSNLTIGKRSDTVDLAKGPNANAGGEVGYLRGSSGTGSNASNYRTVGSAYGGELMRGYGNRGFVVGEKGPEVITPETPITVTPANDVGGGSPINANISIHALDSQGVQDVLVSQKGNIIKMLRQAANASGKTFMEDVNESVHTIDC